MSVKPTEESVRTYLAGHLAQAGNALTELSKAVSAGQPTKLAMIAQMQRCSEVASEAWTALIAMLGRGDWERAAASLNRLDEALADSTRKCGLGN